MWQRGYSDFRWLVALFADRLMKFGRSTELLPVDGPIEQKLLPLTWSVVPRNPLRNIPAITSWMQCCQRSHTHCKIFRNAITNPFKLPTRLIDLSEGRFRLRSGFHKQHVAYLILSHIWGTQSPHVCLKQDLSKKFRKSIPIGKISYIYSEVVRITRAMGY